MEEVWLKQETLLEFAKLSCLSHSSRPPPAIDFFEGDNYLKCVTKVIGWGFIGSEEKKNLSAEN